MITDKLRTTGIGSLPHHNIDAALEHSFKMGIPYLPQIPIRNPWEFMIAQALEGLPGLQVEHEGTVAVHPDIWNSRAHGFQKKLDEAFSRSPGERDAFEAFEPSAASSSSWQPFLWEIQERHIPVAKIQIAGPMTSQWALSMKDGSSLDHHEGLSSQIFRLVLARALGMSRRLQSVGIQPILFLDEPALYALSLSDPKHVMGLQELKFMIQTLRKEGVSVGVHCCSNTEWRAVLGLGLNFLSLDAGLSLQNLLNAGSAPLVEKFLLEGGKLSLGVIPTGRSSQTSFIQALSVPKLFEGLYATFEEAWIEKPDLIRRTLADALYTPACGLALHSAADAELILESLNEFYEFCSAALLKDTYGTA